MVRRISPIQRNHRKIGEVVGQTFIKEVRGSRHLFHRLDAWAIDRRAWEEAKGLGARRIEVRDVEEGRVYGVEAGVFDENAVGIEFGEHGAQLALPRFMWEVLS